MSSYNTPSPSFTETIRSMPSTNSNETSIFSKNNIIIIVLCIIILLLLLNVDILNIMKSILNMVNNILIMIYNLIMQILALFGFVAGNAINVTANVGGNIARSGIDIAEGTLHSIGNVLANGGTYVQNNDIDNVLNTSTISQSGNIPLPDNTGNTIQNPIVTNKKSWCLVGEHSGKRACVEVGQYDKCMSGQVYPHQKMCLNPTLTKNT